MQVWRDSPAEREITPLAQCYNEAPELLSFFPSGEGNPHGCAITVEPPSVLLSAIRQDGEGRLLRLYNSNPEPIEATVTLPLCDRSVKLSFGAHEIKTIREDSIPTIKV